MNWETYNSMSKEQKEEYDFRFKEVPSLNTSNLSSSAISLFALSNMLLMMVYIFVTAPELNFVEDTMLNMVNASLILIQSVGALIIISLLWYIVSLLLYLYKRWRWLKTNNITKQKNTFKWWKLK